MQEALPLQGLRVLDVATWIAAPAAATVLGDYGADIIKVEQPGEGDPHRANYRLSHLPQSEVNYTWHLDSRNKRSLALDLKHPDGRRALDLLISRADVLITNFPFPVRQRLRLDWDDVRDTNPRLIYASFTGYGEQGPDRDQPGFDTNAYFSRAGIVESARYQGNPPSYGLPAQGDRSSALGFLSGILLALYQRERTGKGTKVASSLFANGLWANGVFAQAALLGSFIEPRHPRDRPRNAINNIYKSCDDLWLQVSGVREEKAWPAICRAIDRPSLEHDPRFASSEARRANASALTAVLDEIFRTRDRAYWLGRLTAEAIPNAPIARVQEIPGDAQAEAARAIVPADIPGMPRTIAAPFQLDGVEPRRPGPAPALGSDTDAILSESGLSREEIARLRAAGAIG
jgi:crotonobetainyl-CoA:carnitine CoA-transferase CaiB-like acyl-CoA transferase